MENLKIWSHAGRRSIADLLRTPARLNRYPRIADAGGHECSRHFLFALIRLSPVLLEERFWQFPSANVLTKEAHIIVLDRT